MEDSSRKRKGSRLPKAYDVEARDKEEKRKKREEERGEEFDGFPMMMSFKAFLETQDDYITDEEALHKYGEYKLEFRRQKLNEFFVLHKNQEWFQTKYHPQESEKRDAAFKASVRRRSQVFQELMDKGFLEGVSCDITKEGELVKLLDSVVILLEGGTYEDIKNLDNEPNNNITNGNNNENNESRSSPTDPLPPVKHKTSSLFLKNVPASVCQADLVSVVSRYPGYLRVAFSEADPRNLFTRRCWVTFQRTAKIREICFALNNTPVKGFDVQPVVNKDLSKRIRPGSSLSTGHPVILKDLEAAVGLIRALDQLREVWRTGEKEEKDKERVEENGKVTEQDKEKEQEKDTEKVEENIKEKVEDLTNKDDVTKETPTTSKGERVNPLLSEAESVDLGNLEEVKIVLDKLILYIRIVHSIDFYNQNDYKGEDEMPNRCGLMHVRPEEEVAEQARPDQQLEEGLVTGHLATSHTKLTALTSPPEKVDDTEARKLGVKDEEFELDKFIAANSQELAKDKWLCTLSGKKFKALEFVRKHIVNKFADKVATVKQEVEYFNKYIKDPNRPQLPEEKARPPPPYRPQPPAAQLSPMTAAVAAATSVKRQLAADSSGHQTGGGDGPPSKKQLNTAMRVHDRLGGGRTVGGGGAGVKSEVRVTQAASDPRGLIDYSDVDSFAFDIFG